MTSENERQRLLSIAREAIYAHVDGRRTGEPTREDAVTALGGAFVSLHRRGELRGCIGHIEADQPVEAVIASCAVAASSADPRFPPVTSSEVDDLEIELSLLGPLIPINGPGDIVIGRDGLVVERGWRRGLLLPQVATEWHWDAETFLSQTCHKAGLPPTAWREGAKLWRFEAEVFSEER